MCGRVDIWLSSHSVGQAVSLVPSSICSGEQFCGSTPHSRGRDLHHAGTRTANTRLSIRSATSGYGSWTRAFFIFRSLSEESAPLAQNTETWVQSTWQCGSSRRDTRAHLLASDSLHLWQTAGREFDCRTQLTDVTVWQATVLPQKSTYLNVGKDKVHPMTCLCRHSEEAGYSSNQFVISALEGGGWSVLRPGRFTHCTGRWVVLGAGKEGTENLHPLGFQPRTVQPAASRYTDWARPVTTWVPIRSGMWGFRRVKIDLNVVWVVKRCIFGEEYWALVYDAV